MNPSPSVVVGAYRLAQRFLSSKEFSNSAEIVLKFQNAFASFETTLNERRGKEYSGAILWNSLVKLVNAFQSYKDWIIQTRSLPAGKEKAVEMAIRALTIVRRPKDIEEWYEKNKPKIEFLVGASKWPERSESTDSGEGGASQVEAVGPFRVHNTIGADEKKFKDIKGLVALANQSLNDFDFRKVAYGDLYIVGQLSSRAHRRAWYAVDSDDVYLRILAKKGEDDLQGLLHELGHRYWFKFLSAERKKSFSTWYTQLKHPREYPKVESLNVGDTLPIPVRGVKVSPTIISNDGYRYELSTGGHVQIHEVRKMMLEQAKSQSFPSIYSMVSVEEFFAECFSFFAMGQLKPDLASKFKEIMS